MSEISYIRLSELTLLISNVIRNSFSEHYWVVGEVSGHKFYANNDRHYFDLVEKIDSSNTEAAKIKGKSWEEGSRNILLFEKVTGQKFTNGLQVLVKVKVEYHSIFGLSLTLVDIDQSFTLGNLEKQRRDTLRKLVTDNPDHVEFDGEEYLTFNKKQRLNSVIQNIALVASHNSEGYIDFIHTIEQNKFGFRFNIDNYYSSVQGTEAERELVNTMVSIYNSGKKYDCVVIIRGGGAKTDFLVFDTYNVSRAVARFPVPVITGIGHHKDVSIVDLMAHTSTKTPTKAAEFIISHNHTFEEQILELEKSLIIKTQQTLANAQRRINTLNTSIINNARTYLNEEKETLSEYRQSVINHTSQLIRENRNDLNRISIDISSKPKIIAGKKLNDLQNIFSNIKSFSKKYLENQKGYLGHHSSVIRLMSPQNILKKGFALVSVNGRIVSKADQVKEGEELKISMETIDINTKVISKEKKNGKELNI